MSWITTPRCYYFDNPISYECKLINKKTDTIETRAIPPFTLNCYVTILFLLGPLPDAARLPPARSAAPGTAATKTYICLISDMTHTETNQSKIAPA